MCYIINMIKFFNTLKLYKSYKKIIRQNEDYLIDNYDLQRNIFNELSTTITLVDAPQDLIETYGLTAIVEKNIKEFITKLQNDSEKLDLEELISLYEIKKLNNYDYGITIGFSLMNSRKIFIIKMLMYVLSILLLITGIKIIF